MQLTLVLQRTIVEITVINGKNAQTAAPYASYTLSHIHVLSLRKYYGCGNNIL
jgi:hypothetical protein